MFYLKTFAKTLKLQSSARVFILESALHRPRDERSATGQCCGGFSGPILTASNVGQTGLKVAEVDVLPGMRKKKKKR